METFNDADVRVFRVKHNSNKHKKKKIVKIVIEIEIDDNIS